MNYYYFLEGLDDVFVRDDLVDFNIFPQYTLLTNEQLQYHLEHPEAKRWEIEHHNDPVPELTLEEIKQNKIWEIDAYDSSPAVNEFFINEQSIWLDKKTRTGLNFSLDMEASAGRTESTLWYNNICFTLPILTYKQMLAQLELYAKDCYNVTASHKLSVSNLETKEAVRAYDFTTGYPNKLSFTL